MRLRLAILAVGFALVLGGVARGERTLLADDYLDRLRGMWLGQVLGNYAGRSTEGIYCNPGGDPAGAIDWVAFIHTDPWGGDDDTNLEFLDLRVLSDHPEPTHADTHAAWTAHLPSGSFYIANKQARWLMDDGLVPPATGSIHSNMHWYAIDSQITTESLGAAAPGLRQRAADLAGLFGSVTNDGFALHAAQYYAAMYAAAPFETDLETLVAKGLEAVPNTSRTRAVIEDVVVWYETDRDDGDGTLDWRAAHELLYDSYVGADALGRYRGWIESTVNVGLTTLALLYGEGDFKQTVEIGVRGGFDCDCNPATAGGLIGLMDGFSGLPEDLRSAATDNYHVETLVGLTTDTLITAVAADWQQAAEAQILLAGGSIMGEGAERTYHLPDDDPVTPPVEKPDPSGPRGLVGDVLGAGGDVQTSASIDRQVDTNDNYNLDQIIDGITDQSYNGQRAYGTYDGNNAQPAGGDWYALEFDRDCTFTQVVFYEGHLYWNGINSNPKVTEPLGGYFLDLTVEVGNDDVWVEAANLTLSEPLDTFAYYQAIELEFDPALGDAVRIRGTAGGTAEYTTIVELEAYGLAAVVRAGDADVDGDVDAVDLATLGLGWAPSADDRRWYDGDFDGDGDVDAVDLAAVGLGWEPAGYAAVPAPAPDPGALALAAAGAAVGLARRFTSRTGAKKEAG